MQTPTTPTTTTTRPIVDSLPILDKLAKIDDGFHSSAIVFAILANAGSAGQTMLQITRLVPATTDVNFALLQLDKLYVLVRPFTPWYKTPRPILETNSGKDERNDQKHADTDASLTTPTTTTTTTINEYDPTWILKSNVPFVAVEQYWSKTPILDDKLFRRLLRELSTRPVAISTIVLEQKQESAPFTSKYDYDTVMGTGEQAEEQCRQSGRVDDHVDGQPSYTGIYSTQGRAAPETPARPNPLLVLRHKPLLDDDGVPVQRKNVAYVVRPMTYDEDASVMANEHKSRASGTDTSIEDKIDDIDMSKFAKCLPEPIYKPTASLDQMSTSQFPLAFKEKLDKLPVKTRIRLQMSMGYTAVFLVLAERKSKGVLLNEWTNLIPQGLDYCNGINLAQSAGLVTSAKHNVDFDAAGNKVEIPKLMLHQEHWNLDPREAMQRVAGLVKLRDTMADLNVMVYTITWDVDNALAAPFTFKSKTDDPVPFQHTFKDCTIKDSSMLPQLKEGQCCKFIHYDRLVGLIRYDGGILPP